MSSSSCRSSLLQPFYPALDGLRAVAFIMVFCTHYGTLVSSCSIFKWGWTGVDLFFVLSGFLITGILFDSLHRIDFFRNFYTRRALRIFPLFYGFWLSILLLAPLTRFVADRYTLTMPLYVGNFFLAAGAPATYTNPGLLRFGDPDIQKAAHVLNIAHLWSLCVEEQFYLIWPAIIWFVRSRQALLRLCIAVVIAAPIARLLYAHTFPSMVSSGALYFYSWSRLDALLAGAAVALWMRGTSQVSRPALRRFATAAVCLAPTVFAFAGMFHHYTSFSGFDPFIGTIGFSFTAIASVGLLLLAIDSKSIVYRLLRQPPLMAIGRISYGLYFFHNLPLNFFINRIPWATRHHVSFLIPLGAFALAWIAASLSFRYLESPFLRLKSRLGPPAHPSPVHTAPAHAVPDLA